MDRPSNPVKPSAGGDRRSPQAKVASAIREEQIVALRARKIPFTVIARQVGVSVVSARRTFDKALRRSTDQDLGTYHRTELLELETEQARLWMLVDPQADPKIVIAAIAGILHIHILRVKLLGLDARKKLDIQDMYGAGTDEASAERLQRERVLDAVPLDDQERIYEVLRAARLREAAASIETTGTMVTNATKSRKPINPKEEE
jgi:hypothetical protein